MFQRQIIFKQLQEMRQQQQLQELGDMRQQNYINQVSLNKQSSGGLHPPLVNGMPVHDAPQKFMVGNMLMAQRGISPVIQGFPNGLVFSQSQNQGMSIGMLPQQPDVSLYGTPVTSSGSNISQYYRLQTVSHDSANMLARGNNNQMEIPITQSSTAGNSFRTEQFNASADKVSILDGTFVPKSLFQEKNLFGQVPVPASNDGVLPLNFQQVHMFQRNMFQRNTSMKESGMRQEQNCWSVISPEKTSKLGSPQGTAPLDPLEEKILFNTDDSSWESAFGRHGSIAASGFEGTRELMGTFSSIQSGSWSALMQSAVAEASSSDTGQQEEWSGLTFQNSELSADNQPTNYIGNGKQQNSWVDNNWQSVSSPTSKPDLICPNSNTNYSFTGFEQSNYQVAKQREGMHSDSSNESIQQSPNNAANWFDRKSQQKQPVEGCQLVQTVSPVQGVWHGQQFEHSQNPRRQSSIAQHTDGSQPRDNLAGQDLRENVWQNRSSPQPLIAVSQNQSYQATHSPGNQEQVYPGKLNFNDNVSNIGMNSGKVQMLSIQRNLSSLKEIPPRKNVDTIAALFGNPAEFCGQSIIAHTSENMLDLLVKDTSLEHSSGIHLGSKDSIPSSQVSQIETADDLPYGGISSASQGVSLRLGPSSRQMPISYSSLNCPIPANSSATFTSGPLYMGNHLQNQHMHVAPVASQSAHSSLPGFTSRFQASIATSRDTANLFQASIHSQEYPTLDTLSATLPLLMSAVAQQIGLSMGPSNVSLDVFVPNQQQAFQSEAPKGSLNSLPSPDSTNSNVKMAVGTPNEQGKQNDTQIGSNLKEINECRGTTQGSDSKDCWASLLNSSEVSVPASHNRLVHGQESVTKHLSEINTTNSGSSMIFTPHQVLDRAQQRENSTHNMSERDLEAFGHSLRTSHGLQQDFSLLHQVRYLKNVEAGCSNKVPVKSIEVDSGLNFQYLNNNVRQPLLYVQQLVRNLAHCEQNAVPQLNSFSSGENRPLNCSSDVSGNQPGKDSAKAFIHDNRGIVMFGPTDSHNQFKQNPQINVQMEPSWFKSYGTLKNGQMPPMRDVIGVKDDGVQIPIGKSSENCQVISSIDHVNNTNANQQGSLLLTSATNKAASKQLSPPIMWPSDDTEQDLAVLRPKKRKVGTFDLRPWHKEVTQGSAQLQKIWVSESEWASASNRLIEKVEDEAERNEDVLPIFRAKKRLVLTTQLMQQILRPAPAVLLSADSFSSSESITYFMCRLALGDACSLISDCNMPLLSTDMSSTKQRHSDRIGDQDLLKTVENFMDRAKRLQSDFLRLDKTASILDIRVESQELEKFSVINRFAKFHSRGNIVSGETSSASGAPSAVLRTFAQRYVVAHPMPKTVPDGTNCLSL